METPTRAVPNGGSARHVGEAIGAVASGDGVGELQADARIHVDFAGRRFDFATSNTVTHLGGDDVFTPTRNAALDIGASGALTGGRLADGATAGALGGEVDGASHGPDAQEVGGSFALTGGGTPVIGANGAAR